MQITEDRVYIRRALEGVIDLGAMEAPFDAYRNLAHDALCSLSLPDAGGRDVLLKANATVLYPPDLRIITHPGFLAGLTDALREKDIEPARVVVADGQSGENVERGYTWDAVGYRPMVDARGADLVELNGHESRSVDVSDGVIYQAFDIYERVADCGLFLNVPVAKCHNLSCTTLCIKNLMGVVARPQRHLCSMQEVDKPLGDALWRLSESGLSLYEERFCHKLCDLLEAVRSLGMPRVNVVDGLVGRDGTAFNEGNNHPLGWTVIGQNEVHVDTVATYLMGLDPGNTPYLKLASERGLGSICLAEIEVMDLATQRRMTSDELDRLRAAPALMPTSRYSDGYYSRFRVDGSVVPWRIDDVNAQRLKDGLESIHHT